MLYVLEVLGVKSSGLSLKPESIYTSLERAYTERTLNTYITYLLRNENSLKYTVWHYTLPTRIEGKKKLLRTKLIHVRGTLTCATERTCTTQRYSVRLKRKHVLQFLRMPNVFRHSLLHLRLLSPFRSQRALIEYPSCKTDTNSISHSLNERWWVRTEPQQSILT